MTIVEMDMAISIGQAVAFILVAERKVDGVMRTDALVFAAIDLFNN